MGFSREKRISDAFFVLGAGYFTVARYSASAFLMPICGNLYHHAIEMFLKGFLANSISSSELKSTFGHHLLILWEALKSADNDPGFGKFDRVITTLNRFENIRYPDSIVDDGMMVGITLRGVGPSLIDKFQDGKPTYKLNVEELDELVLKIFEKASVPPTDYFGSLDDEIKKRLPLRFHDGSD